MSFGQRVTCAVLGATVMAVLTSVRPSTAIALTLAITSAALVTDRAGTRRVWLALALVSLSFAHGALARDRALAPPLVAFLGFDGRGQSRSAIVEGVLGRDAEANGAGARLIVDADRIDIGDGLRPVRGRILLTVTGERASGSLRDWTRGRRIRAPALLRETQLALNPGGPGEAWQKLTRRSDVVGTVKSAMLVEVWAGRPWDEAAAQVRAAVRARAEALYATRSRTTEAIVTAILIGDRSGLDDEVEDRLQAAGTYHVVAISGGNIALVTILSLVVLRSVVRRFALVLWMSAIVVVTYGWMVGSDPSVVRASAAAAVYLACSVRGLALAPINVLAAVALVVLLADPLSVVDVGAWLSFGATLGIVVIAPRLVRVWGQRVALISTNDRSLAAVAARAAVTLLAATVAAELCLLPVNAGVFSRVGMAGLVLNFAASPTMAVVQVSGAASVVLANAWPNAASLAADVTHGAAVSLVESARLVDVAPWLTWRVPHPPIIAIAAFYVTLAAWVLWLGTRRVRIIELSAMAAAAAAIVIAPWSWLSAPPSRTLRLTMFDVGQGEAILVQFPTGQTLLVDAGGRSAAFDVGRRVVMPAIWASGARRLDWLAVTHPDLDHIGGAAAIADAFRPREIWEGVPVPGDLNRRVLREASADRGGVWRELRRGDRVTVGVVNVDVLNPPIPDWERQRSRNADSIVLRIRFGDVEYLLTGDLDAATEQALELERPTLLRVLKVGHHGSRTSTSPELLRRLSPQLALVSAGRGNAFGHPAPDVVERLVHAGVEVFRTDRDGAITVETDGREVHVRSMTGRTWTLGVSRLGPRLDYRPAGT